MWKLGSKRGWSCALAIIVWVSGFQLGLCAQQTAKLSPKVMAEERRIDGYAVGEAFEVRHKLADTAMDLQSRRPIESTVASAEKAREPEMPLSPRSSSKDF
jgi:hypothetical protein